MNTDVKLTFFSKNPITCPVCTASFYREELLTGRGRLIAGKLTDEFRRLYEPSQKFGSVNPLIYPVTVCPSCFYSAFNQDFFKVPDGSRSVLEAESERRVQAIREIFPVIDFTENRRLEEGLASYFFAIMCYDYFDKDVGPVIKQGISALRAAWICNDLHTKSQSDNFDYLSKHFYRKARFFYNLAIEYEQNGTQSIAGAGSLGPDTDKNYGYDGLIYLNALLEYRFGPKKNLAKRIERLSQARRGVGKIFGMGRASKDKPAALLDNARDLYDMMKAELEKLNASEEDLADDEEY